MKTRGEPSVKCSRCLSDNPDTSRFCSNCAAPLGPEGQDLPFFTKTIVPSAPALEKGTLFAKKYRISGEIGRGSMGGVFKAEDTKLKRSNEKERRKIGLPKGVDRNLK